MGTDKGENVTYTWKTSSLSLFFKVYVFILKEREREREGQRERERERISRWLCTVSMEPDVGLKLRNRETMT